MSRPLLASLLLTLALPLAAEQFCAALREVAEAYREGLFS